MVLNSAYSLYWDVEWDWDMPWLAQPYGAWRRGAARRALSGGGAA